MHLYSLSAIVPSLHICYRYDESSFVLASLATAAELHKVTLNEVNRPLLCPHLERDTARRTRVEFTIYLMD